MRVRTRSRLRGREGSGLQVFEKILSGQSQLHLPSVFFKVPGRLSFLKSARTSTARRCAVENFDGISLRSCNCVTTFVYLLNLCEDAQLHGHINRILLFLFQALRIVPRSRESESIVDRTCNRHSLARNSVAVWLGWILRLLLCGLLVLQRRVRLAQWSSVGRVKNVGDSRSRSR